MDQVKFDRMVREFPFLSTILQVGAINQADLVEDIQVRRADRNLLEVRPGSWHHDAGSFNRAGFRNFWIVSPGEVICLKDGFWRTEYPYGTTNDEKVGLIANQLVDHLSREISHIVEVTNEWYDWADQGPTVIIYKMNDLAWRRFCRPISDRAELIK